MSLDVGLSSSLLPRPTTDRIQVEGALAVAAHMTAKAGPAILAGLEDSFEKQAGKTQ